MRNRFLFILAFAFLCTSCLFDEKDFFDKPASERIEDAKVQAKSILEGASNGWHVRYFPSPNREFGGYNVFFKFENGNALIASETMSDFSKPETSLYSLGEDLGVTLNFDTKNSVLNYFVHPRNPDGLGSSYKGIEGDYKFTVISATPEEVVLRGIISGNRYVMTPLPSGVSWEEELKALVSSAEDMAFNTYTCEVNGKSYPVTLTNRRFAVKLSEEETVYAPFIYTKTGISLYEPVTIDGQTAKDFNFVDEYYFEEINKVAFRIMTPTPIRSDITFDLKAVPEYSKVGISVIPSNDNELFYVGYMTKDEYESIKEKKHISSIVGDLNTYIGAGDDAQEVAETLLDKGAGSWNLKYPDMDIEYVAFVFGCAVSDGSITGTTKMTVAPFVITADLLPADTEQAYRDWLGNWEVTSASSEKNNQPYSFNITVKPDVANKSFKIRGWGYDQWGDVLLISSTYLSGGKLGIAGEQKNLYNHPSGGTLSLRARMVYTDTNTYGTLTTSSTSALNASFDEGASGRTATMVGQEGTTSSKRPYRVTGMVLWRASGGSNYYIPQAQLKPGFVYQDFLVGPYTMKKLD